MESQRFFTGSPVYQFYMTDKSASQHFSAVKNALANNWAVGVDTSGSTAFGLVSSHAYAVFATYEIKDTNGNIVA
jgi:hypothetical protein